MNSLIIYKMYQIHLLYKRTIMFEFCIKKIKQQIII